MPAAAPRDEDLLRDLPADALTPDRRAALDRVLTRLAAAEKVCLMVGTSLSPKRRATQEKKTYWFDVGVAVKQWEDLATGADAASQGETP
jgi:ABC-type cobalamin transport system ATPase subunit